MAEATWGNEIDTRGMPGPVVQEGAGTGDGQRMQSKDKRRAEPRKSNGSADFSIQEADEVEDLVNLIRTLRAQREVHPRRGRTKSNHSLVGRRFRNPYRGTVIDLSHYGR